MILSSTLSMDTIHWSVLVNGFDYKSRLWCSSVTTCKSQKCTSTNPAFFYVRYMGLENRTDIFLSSYLLPLSPSSIGYALITALFIGFWSHAHPLSLEWTFGLFNQFSLEPLSKEFVIPIRCYSDNSSSLPLVGKRSVHGSYTTIFPFHSFALPLLKDSLTRD